MCFQESLLRGVEVGTMERRAAGHTAHAEYVHFLPVSGKLGIGFVPIHLRFLAKRVALRDADLFGSATERAFLPRDVPSDRRFGNRCLRLLPPKPQVNAMRRMPLLARRTLVRLQSRVDELFHWPQPRLRSLGSLAERRLSIGQCWPHHSKRNDLLLPILTNS